MSEAGHTNSPGATRQLAEFIACLDTKALPADVVTKIKQCMLDGIACCVFGATLEPVRKLISMVKAEQAAPVASLIGSAARHWASRSTNT